MLKQRTLASQIKAAGIGLHTGKKISLHLKPAQSDSGIIFQRTDVNSRPIKASLENVFDTRLSTSLSNSEVKISTVEHCERLHYVSGRKDPERQSFPRGSIWYDRLKWRNS